MKKAAKIVGIEAGVILLLAVLLILTLTVTEYRPADREILQIDQGTEMKTLAPGDELNVVSWNVGYGALGDNADFFMDGGKMVQSADQNRVTENLLGMIRTVPGIRTNGPCWRRPCRGRPRCSRPTTGCSMSPIPCRPSATWTLDC